MLYLRTPDYSSRSWRGGWVLPARGYKATRCLVPAPAPSDVGSSPSLHTHPHEG